jgi:hypothetical protein
MPAGIGRWWGSLAEHDMKRPSLNSLMPIAAECKRGREPRGAKDKWYNGNTALRGPKSS